MNFEIKPGTLCFVRGATGHLAGNNGKIVLVTEAAGVLKDLPKCWYCTSKEALRCIKWATQTPAVIAPGGVLTVPEANLLPIAGPGLEDDVCHYDSHPLIDKKVAVRVASSSTRSTPNVRR